MARFGKKDDIHVTPDTSHIHNPDVSHEESDVNIKSIVIFAVGLLAMGLVVHILMLFMYRALDAREAAKEGQPPPMALTSKEQVPPEPRLQAAPGWGVSVGKSDTAKLKEQGYRVNQEGQVDLELREPQAEMKVMRQVWEAELKGGTDSQTGQRRMSIDEAKQRLVQQGLPTRPVQDGKQKSQAIEAPTFWSSGQRTELVNQ
ncbi:MAG TPA: hypothetical protein VGB17_19415 [Pyrinomonadaceae bacterium]|jgi:hypothetical protein